MEGRNFTSTGALSQVCLGLPAMTTLDNYGTSWFQILDNCFRLDLALVCVQERGFDYPF